jgi:hypothetical protein
MGYLASEFRGSITVDALRNIAVPTLHENFFEFVERSEWEANTPTYRRLDELEEGTEYYVIVTTHAGLFRYSIDDIVKATGKFHETRNSDRLKPLEVLIINPGTGEAYKKHCINRTQRESQHKIAHLQYKGEQTFDFESYVC